MSLDPGTFGTSNVMFGEISESRFRNFTNESSLPSGSPPEKIQRRKKNAPTMTMRKKIGISWRTPKKHFFFLGGDVMGDD